MTAFGRNPAEKRERGPLYQFTTFQLHGASFAAIAIGLAQATLDAFHLSVISGLRLPNGQPIFPQVRIRPVTAALRI